MNDPAIQTANTHPRGDLRVRVVLAFCLTLLVMASPQARAAEELPPLTIAQIKEDRNHDTIPDLLGQVVRTRGVVTVATGDIRSEMLEIVIEDHTGGIFLFDPRPPLNYQRGEELEIYGKVGQYRGKEQLIECNITRLGQRSLPEPKEQRLDGTPLEALTGTLVTMEGGVRAINKLSNGDFVTLAEAQHEISVVVSHGSRLNRWDDSAWPLNSRIRITGVLSQYCFLPPYDSSYQLLPLRAEDIKFLKGPSLISTRELIWTGSVALFVSLILGAWIVTLRAQLRRRSEELRQANERIVGAHQVEAVVRTSATLHHEINNPLTAILASAQLALMRKDLDPSLVQKLQTIQEMSERISKAVGKLSQLTEEVRVRKDWGEGYIDVDRSR